MMVLLKKLEIMLIREVGKPFAQDRNTKTRIYFDELALCTYRFEAVLVLFYDVVVTKIPPLIHSQYFYL